MKVLVTGAGGFLGRAVAAAAARAGHQVLAMVRPVSLAKGGTFPAGVTPLAGDLRQRGAWCDAIGDVDAVVHCAAAFGDLPSQLAGTVLATENLLAALPHTLRRIVHVSSLSVYDFDAPKFNGVLDEATPLERDPLRRDAYTQTKLLQERLVRDHATRQEIELVVVRPGAIYGPGKDWDAGTGLKAGRFDLIFAPRSRMRLVHVDNCADAIVAALAAPLDAPLTVDLIDPEQPSHWRYHRLAKQAGVPTGIAVPVPYVAVLALGWSAKLASRLFFKGKARLPELLDPPRQRVRWRPLHYPNVRAREALGWTPRVDLATGVARLVKRAD
ncbi:MAG: NAD-dependent epimerase/dehydratase family protein [Sphingomonas sp.]|uniref:NAD-dependent epimerase/dehydratase family protein n=1 Tax=Sphingomonas sp. TaxID=28214 RepID=UPI001ACC6182|nr:NAD-dependent epimerase/dehydratase family protein [Sphingomonas sp.]MBN8808844.1 NAD-dependent epimerase/dehydratase family protein [Sphingomonas sp.]